MKIVFLFPQILKQLNTNIWHISHRNQDDFWQVFKAKMSIIVALLFLQAFVDILSSFSIHAVPFLFQSFQASQQNSK